MKYTFVILSLILLSCQKVNTEQLSTSQYYIVGARSVEVANGASSTFDVIKLGGGEQKSVWMSVNTTTGRFIQAGYTMWGGIQYAAMMFYGTDEPETIQLNPQPILQAGGKYKFSIYMDRPGKWRISVNDLPISEFNESSTNITTATVSIECASAPKPAQFPTINAYPAIQLYDVQTKSYRDAVVGGSWGQSSSYGVEGVNQNNKLKQNEVNMGSKVKTKVPALLWNNL